MRYTLPFVLLFLAGCVTTHYKKSVTVTRDPSGKILSIVEYEEAWTPNQTGHGITFEYLPGIQVNNKKARTPVPK